MRKLSQSVAQLLIRIRWPLLLIAVVLAALAYVPAGQLDFDRSIEKMFADDDPLLPPYYKLKETFGGNEVVLVVYTDEDLLKVDGSGIKRLEKITTRLKEVPGVQDVLSLAEINEVLDFIRSKDPRPYEKLCIVDPPSNLGGNYRDLFEKYTHGSDRKTVAAVCMLYPQGRDQAGVKTDSHADEKTLQTQIADMRRDLASKKARDEELRYRFNDTNKQDKEKRKEITDERSLLQKEIPRIKQQLQELGAGVPRETTIELLRQVAADLPDNLETAWVVGEPAMVVDGFRYVEEDGRRLGIWTTLLLGLTILVFFRSIRWVVIPLAVVQLAVLLTKATLVVSGLDLSMVSSMLTAIVTVTGIATVVHITMRFREAREDGLTPYKAFERTASLLAAPVFWTCMTTAVGFGSLLFAKVEPIQDFGVMMAIGSLFVLVCVTLVVPGLTLLGRFDSDPRLAWGEDLLHGGLQKLIAAVEKAPWAIGTVSLVIVAITISGTRWLEVETDFTKNFRSHTPIVQSYQFVENNLGGAGVWDVILPAPKTADNAELTNEYLTLVRDLETKLRNIPTTPISEDEELPAGWQRHHRLPVGFSAAFPAEPEEKQIRDKQGLRSFRYQATSESSVVYQVFVHELSAEQMSQDQSAILINSVKKYAGEDVESREITSAGHAGRAFTREFKHKSDLWISDNMIFVLESRLYRIAVSRPKADADSTRYQQFVDSIRFVTPALTKVVSVADADEATKVTLLLTYAGPRARLTGMQTWLTTFYRSMLNTKTVEGDVGYLRVMLRAPERQPASQKLELIERVKQVVERELESEEWRILRASLLETKQLRESVTEFLEPQLDDEQWKTIADAIEADADNLALLTQAKELSGEHLGEARFGTFLDSQELPEAETTGFFVLLTNLISSIIRDQWVCFGIATVAIAVMMTVAFRSPILAIVALIPNALPILMVFGLMGWLGAYSEEIKLNMGAAMIAAVSMGLSVDSSIHYIISFRRAREDGLSVHDALTLVQQSVGRAAVFSTLALVVGFSVLCTSSFVPTIYFGVLVGLSMLGGLFGNLVVLPLLLRLVTRESPATS